jgi:hypothetical protein
VIPHKVIAKIKNSFSTFPSAQNGGKIEGEVESGRLKHQFS